MSNESYGQLLGQLIKKRRVTQGLTQLQLSEDAYGDGKRVRRISELETGKVENPHPKTIDPIISVLKISDEEIENCAEAIGGRQHDELTDVYRESSNLIETLLYRFDHNNPEAGLSEIDDFLKSKANEWRQLTKKIKDMEATGNILGVLREKAMSALSEGKFSEASELLAEAEETQTHETLEQVAKLARLRILRAQIDLLAGEKEDAIKKFTEAANYFAPFDQEEQILLLDNLAIQVYELSRRSTYNNFDVADRLLKEALYISEKDGDEQRVAQFKSNIAMMHRNQSEREPPKVALELLEKAILFCREALNIFDPKVDLNAWASSKIQLGNCLMEAGKFYTGNKYIETATESLGSFRQVVNTPNINHELDELMCHASNGLGNGLMQLMNTDEQDRTEPALEAYYNAIKYTELSHDSDMWGAAHINIGNLLASTADKTDNEKEAQYLRLRSIGSFLSAIEVYPTSFFPYQFAQAQYSLGMIYFKYGMLLRNEVTESYLFKALMSLESAGSVFTEEHRPKKWADMEHFKAMIFALHAELKDVDSTEHDFKMAKGHVNEAIRVYKELNEAKSVEKCQDFLAKIS